MKTRDYSFKDPSGKCGWGYHDGWNGSYHEAMYNPKLYAWGKGKKKFQLTNDMMKLATEWYKSQVQVDPSTARFRARRQIRPGD